MPYFFFDRCGEDKVPLIEDLVDSYHLEEQSCHSPSTRQWRGDIEGIGYLVKYKPSLEKLPLMVQTYEGHTIKEEKVKDMLRKFIDICQPKQIYMEFDIPYDMGEFE
jgi:hypothetical protein